MEEKDTEDNNDAKRVRDKIGDALFVLIKLETRTFIKPNYSIIPIKKNTGNGHRFIIHRYLYLIPVLLLFNNKYSK